MAKRTTINDVFEWLWSDELLLALKKPLAGVGWNDGGCVALALGLREVLGEGEIVAIVHTSRQGEDIYDHAMLELVRGNRTFYLDANGFHHDSRVLERFEQMQIAECKRTGALRLEALDDGELFDRVDEGFGQVPLAEDWVPFVRAYRAKFGDCNPFAQFSRDLVFDVTAEQESGLSYTG